MSVPRRAFLSRVLALRPNLSRTLGAEAVLLHPVRLGAVLLVVPVAGILTAQWMLGRVPFGRAGLMGDMLLALLHGVILAYVVAGYFAVLRRGTHTVDALRPELESPRATGAILALPPLAPPTAGWIVAALLGAVFGFFGPYLTEPQVSGPLGFWHVGGWQPEVYWHRLLGLGIGVGFSWFAFAVVHVSRQLSRLARDLRRVDIFDVRPLQPFVRQGLTNGLLAAGLLSLVSLFALDQGLTSMLLLFGGAATVVVGVAILLPVLGVHQRIVAAKQAELAWCEAALERERQALRGGRAARREGRLADLSAYRTLVQQVREWPFDMPAVRLMVLFLLIPLGSWVASAIVQHLVERFLLAP